MAYAIVSAFEAILKNLIEEYISPCAHQICMKLKRYPIKRIEKRLLGLFSVQVQNSYWNRFEDECSVKTNRML